MSRIFRIKHENLSRNTEVLDCFSLKNVKLMPVLCDQVTQCSASLTFSHVSATSMNGITYTKQKNYGSHMIGYIHNNACELLHIHCMVPAGQSLFFSCSVITHNKSSSSLY